MKVKVQVGWSTYVMEQDAAFALFKAFTGTTVEKVESDYRKEVQKSFQYVKEVPDDFLTITPLSNENYGVMRLYAATKEQQKQEEEARKAKEGV